MATRKISAGQCATRGTGTFTRQLPHEVPHGHDIRVTRIVAP